MPPEFQPAGKYDTRAVFERRMPGTGTRGESTGDWYELARVSAEFVPLSGSELEIARERIATASARLTIRRPRQWTPNERDRVRVGGLTYYVFSATPNAATDETVCGLSTTKPKD